MVVTKEDADGSNESVQEAGPARNPLAPGHGCGHGGDRPCRLPAGAQSNGYSAPVDVRSFNQQLLPTPPVQTDRCARRPYRPVTQGIDLKFARPAAGESRL